MSKKIGEVTSAKGRTWQVWVSLAGVELDGEAGIEPDDASALARLMLDAALEARAMRIRAELSDETTR